MVLIDTDVVIECLQGSAAARKWLDTLASDRFALPGVVAMELVMGCRNRNELRRVENFLRSFKLIAAMALCRGCRLYSFNMKHFQTIAGLDVQPPFQRS